MARSKAPLRAMRRRRWARRSAAIGDDDAGQDAEQAERRPRAQSVENAACPLDSASTTRPSSTCSASGIRPTTTLETTSPATRPRSGASRDSVADRCPKRHDRPHPAAFGPPPSASALRRGRLVADAVDRCPAASSSANTAGMNHGVPLNSGTAAGGRKPSAETRLRHAEHLLRRLLPGPARPHHARAAIARRIAHAVLGEDARDHVAVHGHVADTTYA